MYCTVDDVVALLPPPITVGDENLGTPSPGREDPVNRSKMTPEEVTRFIRFATEEVDSRLRPYYVCPLRRTKSFETEILENVSNGENVEVRVHDSGVFAPGQMVRLQNRTQTETDTIASVKNLTKVVVTRVKNSYAFDESKISILEFPDPIPLITARLAVSYAFDRLFSAEQSPNVSEYGKGQRTLAMNALDSILSGAVFLFGQDHTGKRFIRGSLLDAFQNSTPDFSFGRERE